MPVTTEQRVDLGTRYVAEIQRRIAVRTEAKAALPEAPKNNSPEVLAAVAADFKTLGIALGPFKVAAVDENNYGNPTYDFEFAGGAGCELSRIAQSKFPSVKALLGGKKATEEKRGKLCRELEFLNSVISGTAIAAFQSYCARLWAPTSKSERLSGPDFRARVEAFLDTKRGFTRTL